MRKYKIIEEKIPSEDFTRWIPMVTNTIEKSGVIVDEPTLWKWELLPNKLPKDRDWWIINDVDPYSSEVSYCKNLLDAQKLIDRHENYKKHEEGDFIVNEFEYKPKPI